MKNTLIDQKRLTELERVIVEFQDQLFRFAFFRVGSMPDSQDIVQNVFIKMYHDKTDLSAINNVKAYLFRSVSNSCIDYLRRKNKHRSVSLDTVIAKADDEDEKKLIHEYERIEKLMAEIPAEQAEIIKMKTINNLSFVSIADILGIPLTTVKSRFKYGIDKLRSKIN